MLAAGSEGGVWKEPVARSNMAEEGQDSVYVVLDLEGAVDLPPPGCKLLLQGMETAQPTLQLADGTRLLGAFEETIGEQLVLSDATQPDGSHRVQLLAHTDKRITFRQAAPPAGTAAADEAAATAATGGGTEEGGAALSAQGMDVEATASQEEQEQQQEQQQQQQQPGGGGTT
ncbi:hypothetical protein ABPG75_000253 [Micractinium tetrahymenae]